MTTEAEIKRVFEKLDLDSAEKRAKYRFLPLISDVEDAHQEPRYFFELDCDTKDQIRRDDHAQLASAK